MNKQHLVRLFAVSAGAVPGLLLSASIASAQAISSDGFPASVPKAICGPTDHTESGLQGETTEQERFSGDSEIAYNCNLQLVGERVEAGLRPIPPERFVGRREAANRAAKL